MFARTANQQIRRAGSNTPLKRSYRSVTYTVSSPRSFSQQTAGRRTFAKDIPQRFFSSSQSAESGDNLYSDDTVAARSGQGPDRFVYRVSAAYCGKTRKFDTNKHYYTYDSATDRRWLAGKPSTTEELKQYRTPSGQDACFISEVSGNGASAFGLTDGVGGWIDQGIDSADFAHGICTYMAEAAVDFKSQEESKWNGTSPKQLLRIGHAKVYKDPAIEGGGSTACIAVADKIGQLNVANLGDSGFMTLRLNKVHYYSAPQTHAFNTPFQLSRIPPKILAQMKMFGGNAPFQDKPDDANDTTHELEHGDVLVFATDGVWDNLSSEDVLKLVSEKMVSCKAWNDEGNGISVSAALLDLVDEHPEKSDYKPLHASIATAVVEAAKSASQDDKRDGPFAKAVQRKYPHDGFRGGKVDDICVLAVIAIDTLEAEKLKGSGARTPKL